jgi:GT2 family glycosyltransferase
MKHDATIRIAALVPIHNGMPHVLDCIQSLRECSQGGSFVMKVIVIDDGSTDDSTRLIQESFPEVEILAGDGNLWWTGAMDLGVTSALAGGCDYVFWLNHDDRVTSSALPTLLAHARSHPQSIGCCAVANLSEPEGRTLLGYRVHYNFVCWYLESLYGDSKNQTGPVDLDLNGGHGILIPAELFSNPKNHLRPNLFPHYFGDFDFFHRVRRNGWPVVSVPGAMILNDDRNSGIINGKRISSYKQSIPYITSRRSIANLRDRPLFALLNFPWGLNLIWFLIFLIIPIGCAIVYPALAWIQKLRSNNQSDQLSN